jgi:hypothetical protein
MMLLQATATRSGGCKAAHCRVLSRADILDIDPPCVLALLAFRSPGEDADDLAEHR